jgi:hypothetical protein
MLPHMYTIELLERFLNDHVIDKHIQGVSIKTISKLVHLVLRNQFFIYNNTVYCQSKGGQSNLPLTILLANIYVLHWQKELVHILHTKKEIFGR